MTTARERLLARKAEYYRKNKAKWALKSSAEAARRRADPALREAFNAKQREYYAKREGVADPVLPVEESAELKRAWNDRF